MKKALFLLAIVYFSIPALSQKVDSIAFHLYTDSLKKGQHNYINVDGKFSNGQWQPLTSKELRFSSSACEFQGNELVVPPDFKEEKIKIKAELKSNPAIWKEVTVWIKKIPDPDSLPGLDQVLQPPPHKKKKKN
ncbi:MAG TPA: hypothetical protein VGQ53_00020 [Chitinophagaceae bacterium]|jgi:hypothetical protein|nr:hypothetical protein [Chitinophagaceae bacterium]